MPSHAYIMAFTHLLIIVTPDFNHHFGGYTVYHIFRPKCREGRSPKIGLPPNHPCSSICRWNFHFNPSSLLGVGVLWLPLKWAQLSMLLYCIYTHICHICRRISQTSETLFELGPWLWLPLKWYQLISNMYVIVCINIYIYIFIYLFMCVPRTVFGAHQKHWPSHPEQKAATIGLSGIVSSLWNHRNTGGLNGKHFDN